MLKPTDNPPLLAGDATQPSDLSGPWWVGHTKARQEKALAWDLQKAGAGYFLPLVSRVMISGGRKRKVLKPLFTSYIFFTGSEELRYQALATNRLCTVLPVTDQSLLLSELDQVHRALEGEAELDVYPGLTAGRWARVTAGAFQGMEGRILDWQGSTRLLLQVSMLGQGAAVEIDADLLEPLDQDEPISQVGGL
jgi:transcription antitermination factor NusG